MKKLLTAAMLAMLGIGCRGLMIQPGDGSALAASKVAARVPLAVVSVGMSEIQYACVRNNAPTEGVNAAWNNCNRGMAQFGAAMAESSRSRESHEVSCQTTCYPIGGGALDCRSVCR